MIQVKTGYVPVATENMRLFDENKGARLKNDGMDAAAEYRAEVLEFCRGMARKAALRRRGLVIDDQFQWHSEATIDDVYKALEASERYSVADLGNAAGSVFKTSEWVAVGWQTSTRASNHGRAVRVWRLK